MISLELSYQHNQKLTKSYAKTFYLVSKFLPKAVRNDIYAVYGFCRHSDNLVDEEPDLSKAKNDLEAWRKALQTSIEVGQSDDIVLKSFIYAVKKYNIDPKLAFDLLDGMEMDLVQSRYRSFDDLLKYCYLVASVPGLLVLNILGWDKKTDTKKAAIALGQAMQITNILRDIKEDYSRGRIYLPLDDLQKYGISETDFAAQKISPRLIDLVKNYIQRARELYQNSEQGLAGLSANSRFAVRLANKMYGSILDKIEQNQYDVFTKRASLSLWEKIRLVF